MFDEFARMVLAPGHLKHLLLVRSSIFSIDILILPEGLVLVHGVFQLQVVVECRNHLVLDLEQLSTEPAPVDLLEPVSDHLEEGFEDETVHDVRPQLQEVIDVDEGFSQVSVFSQQTRKDPEVLLDLLETLLHRLYLPS